MGDAVNSGGGLAEKRTSGLAIASLVLGIVGIVVCGPGCVAGIAAVILGIVALAKIGESQGQLGGRGLAIGGIVTGGISVVLAFIAIVAAIAIPSLMGSRIPSDEAAAVACLRTCAGAQNMYRRSDYDGDMIFEYAHPYVKLNTEEAGGQPIRLINDSFANASRDNPPGGVTISKAGYVFIDLVGDAGGEAYHDGKGNFVAGYGLCAVPEVYNRTGRNTFVINIQGTVYMKDNGGKPVTKFPDVAAEGWVAAGQ